MFDWFVALSAEVQIALISALTALVTGAGTILFKAKTKPNPAAESQFQHRKVNVLELSYNDRERIDRLTGNVLSLSEAVQSHEKALERHAHEIRFHGKRSDT